MVRTVSLVIVASLAGVATACGSSSSSSGSGPSDTGTLTLTGDVTGTWHRGGADVGQSTCDATRALIPIRGPAEDDEGFLTVKSDGSVLFDVEKYGDYTATSGGTLRAGQGFDINADISTPRGKKAHISGSLSC